MTMWDFIVVIVIVYVITASCIDYNIDECDNFFETDVSLSLKKLLYIVDQLNNKLNEKSNILDDK